MSKIWLQDSGHCIVNWRTISIDYAGPPGDAMESGGVCLRTQILFILSSKCTVCGGLLIEWLFHKMGRTFSFQFIGAIGKAFILEQAHPRFCDVISATVVHSSHCGDIWVCVYFSLQVAQMLYRLISRPQLFFSMEHITQSRVQRSPIPAPANPIQHRSFPGCLKGWHRSLLTSHQGTEPRLASRRKTSYQLTKGTTAAQPETLFLEKLWRRALQCWFTVSSFQVVFLSCFFNPVVSRRRFEEVTWYLICNITATWRQSGKRLLVKMYLVVSFSKVI